MIANRQVTHALSFDIEDWFHLVEVEATADPATWDTFPTIVVERTREILDILSEYNVRATFFMLGWVAARHPDLVPTNNSARPLPLKRERHHPMCTPGEVRGSARTHSKPFHPALWRAEVGSIAAWPPPTRGATSHVFEREQLPHGWDV